MIDIKKIWRGVILLLALLIAGCGEEQSVNIVDSAADQSLVPMIEKQIAEKKQREALVEQFRQQHISKTIAEKIETYLPSIRKYAAWYGLDWRLIVAQILKESRFKENARSHVGAMGLMQIMPRTAQEITRELDIAYISKDPRENITAGIYHMYKQLQYFEEADPENQLKLALAAYNCGPARIFDAREIARFKNLDPDSWEAVRDCLPLLTRENWQLHLEVWPQGVPDYGYFYGSDQTIDYVDSIHEKYMLLIELYEDHPSPAPEESITPDA